MWPRDCGSRAGTSSLPPRPGSGSGWTTPSSAEGRFHSPACPSAAGEETIAIQFDIVVQDRPGELGRLAATLAEKGVNIDAISAATGGGKGYVGLLIAEARKARDVLRSAGYEFVERTVLTVTLEDRPGTLGELSRRLGAAGVNVTSVLTLTTGGGRVQLAIGVDDIERARRVV